MSEWAWSEPKTLQQAKLNITAELGYVEKQSVPNVTWKALMESDVIEAVKPLMVKNRLTVTIIDTELLHSGAIAVYKNPANHAIVKLKAVVTFERADGSGKETESVSEIGEDLGYQSVSKPVCSAQTMAHKNLFRRLFLLESGNDPERIGAPPPENAGGQGVSNSAAGNKPPTHADEETQNAKMDGAVRALKNSPSIEKLKSLYEWCAGYFTGDRLKKLTEVTRERGIELKGQSPPQTPSPTTPPSQEPSDKFEY